MIPLKIDDDIKYWEDKLIAECSSLGNSLIHFAQRFKSDKKPIINGNGEIQGRALSIDLLCARIATLQSVRDQLNKEVIK